MIATESLRAAPYLAALLAGVTGSVHCIAMCGGIAGALAMRAHRRGSEDRGHTAAIAIAHHAGRLASYAVAGALAGGFGQALAHGLAMPAFGRALRIGAGIAIILMGIRMAGIWNAFAAIEGAGARLWRRLSPFAMRMATRETGLAAFALGACWGWLPCGLVYSMLLLAALGGSALAGAAIMFAFGVGTLVAMLPGSLLAARGAAQLTRRGARRWAAVLLIAFGVATMSVPIAHPGAITAGHVHHAAAGTIP
jgi:uncharacterized protein